MDLAQILQLMRRLFNVLGVQIFVLFWVDWGWIWGPVLGVLGNRVGWFGGDLFKVFPRG